MKHLKKFESTNNKNFDISEVSDIINEFADSFEVEEEDIDIAYHYMDKHISSEIFLDKDVVLKQRKSIRVFVVGMLSVAVLGGIGLILAIFQMIKHYAN